MFGALGALARYGADVLIEQHTKTLFPLSTFAVNVSGCILAGVAVGGLVDRGHEPAWLTVGAVTGFLGAYTTFSAFAFETRDLEQEGHLALAAANAAGNVLAGVAGIYVGLLLTGR